jgi:hypothetical protein
MTQPCAVNSVLNCFSCLSVRVVRIRAHFECTDMKFMRLSAGGFFNFDCITIVNLFAFFSN